MFQLTYQRTQTPLPAQAMRRPKVRVGPAVGHDPRVKSTLQSGRARRVSPGIFNNSTK